MTARLRGHHLICLQTFAGQGYSEHFVRNLREVLLRAEKSVVVVEGADDVCAACPTLVDGRCEHSSDSDEIIKELDDLALELTGFAVGDRLSLKDVREMPSASRRTWQREACGGCEWVAVCDPP